MLILFSGHPDPNEWPNKVIRPDRGSFEVSSEGETKVILTELLPNKQYFLRVALHVKESGEEITSRSDILSVTTPTPGPSGPPGVELRPIDVELQVGDVKDDSAFISWRFFSFDEKQYIDGVQIRYTSLLDGSGVPGTTPFIHRDTNFFALKGMVDSLTVQ